MTFREREVERKTTLTIEAVEDVTVPAGTFEACIKLATTTVTQRSERKRTAWYATSVGLVESERPGCDERPATTSELTEYEIAE